MEPLQVISSMDDGPYAVGTVLGWTVNGPLRGGSDAMEANKATEVTANRISVAKLEELWQLQFKQDFPDAGQDENIKMSKDDHQFINMVSESSKLFYKEYVTFMVDILKKGYAVKLDVAERKPTEGRTWYLPHHESDIQSSKSYVLSLTAAQAFKEHR
ncbi:hypothetical protein N1851_012368 [Merluccius polli]|uniref:Uncharacterized protein n=1 Tax=Merluccius polli TaxID=89951 RepID=A0AA47P5Z9_MERPO|nr:hypothetical protein N1851_012368 [Merluccius polli]